MADPNVGFFNPAGLTGFLSAWNIQSENPNTTKTRAQGLGEDGDELASKLHDTKQSITIVAKCFATTGNLALPSIGALFDGYHLDSFVLKKIPTDYPEISCQLHKHASAHEACRTYTPSLTVAAGFGIERAPGGFALAVGDTAIGWESWEYAVGCTHLDVLGGGADGSEHLKGENRDGVETVKLQLTGAGATITAPEGFVLGDSTGARSNTAAETTGATYEHHLAFDVEET